MELDVDMKMEADRERESNDLTAMAMSKSGIEDESKPEEKVIAEREKVDCDEDSVSKGNLNNEGAASPDSIQTSRTDFLLIQTENLIETLSARLYSAEERLGLEMTSEDGPKSINAALPFGKALSKSKVPENAAMMKATAEYSVQLQSPDCESPEIDPFCRASTEDVNDSWNTTDRDLNTQQGIYVGMDDSTSDCYHGHHSDNQEETNHVPVVTDNITQDMNLDYLLQNNKELKDNSTADQVKPSISRNHSTETVQNPQKHSVIANELSKPSFSDDKPGQKPSKFRKLWAQRNSDPQKSFVTTSNFPLLPSVLASPPAVEATERLQKVVPSPVGSEPEPGKNWGARVAKGRVLQEVRKAEENPVDIAGYKSSDSGLFRPQVSGTPRSVGITSQAIFRTESVEDFRTESKQSQHKLPKEMRVSTPAHQVMIVTNEPEKNSPAPVAEVSSSSEEITDAYICYMIEKINKLKLKDFAFPRRGELWENDWKQKNDIPLVKATVRRHFDTLTTFLNRTVAASEDIFIEHICFPVPVKMDRELGRIFDVPPSLITELPDDFITVLHSAISAFREEYRQRNRQILAHETQIREILMDHSVDYFRQELYFQAIEEPSKKYVDLEDFRQIEGELRKSVTRNFFSVCSPDFWRAKLEQPLKDRLEATVRSIMDVNRNSKAQMDVLLALANEAIDVYENSMREFEMGQSFERRKEMFKGHDQAAHSQALQVFETGSSQVHGFHEQHQICLQEVITRLDKSTNNRWGSIVQEENRIAEEQARVAREQARIAQEEDNRRKKEEAERREMESRRQLARTEIRNPQHKHTENFDASNDIGNKEPWRLTDEDDGKNPGDPRAQCMGASSATNNSVGFNWVPSNEMHGQTSLPSMELAIHMGLYHTQVAFITPATGKFNPVANVRNRLYWNQYEHELMPAFVEALASGPPVINFEEHIARLTDMAYEFSLRQRKFSWDLEDVLSQFLISLKRQAEVDSRREFNSCVVAVPQFLNTSQRLRIQQSANIAGFDEITFVNDTTAIAAVHMVDEELLKGNVVVVNTQEGAVDVASFAFDHGKLDCHGVTGSYFFEDHADFLDKIAERVTKLFASHPKNAAKKFFTQNELHISLSSSNTKFLLLGKGENRNACYNAIRKATNYAKDDEIHDIEPETVVYGTAYICCLRSRDACNSVLLKWQDKLQPSSKVIENKILDEVERKILRPERKLKKNMNVTTGHLLTPEGAQHRRTKLNNNNKAVLHRERLGILKLIDSVEKSLGLSDEVVSKSVRQDLDCYYKLLFQQDVNPQKLENIKEEIITYRSSVFQMQGSFV